MEISTKGIVLHQVPYSDSRRIVRIFTEKLGIRSFAVNRSSGKRSGKNSGSLLPLSIVEFTTQERENREIFSTSAFRSSIPLLNLQSDPAKTAIALFLAEMLYRSLSFHDKDEPFYHFLENSLQVLDQMEKPSNFHLGFLLKVSGFLGFSPALEFDAENDVFDLQEGQFTSTPPLHPHVLEPPLTGLFCELAKRPLVESGDIKMRRNQRSILLVAIVEYFRLHISGLQSPRSLEILETIFNTDNQTFKS